MKANSWLLILVILFTIAACKNKSSPDSDKKNLVFAAQSPFKHNIHPVDDGYFINLQPLMRLLYSTLYNIDSNLKPYPFLIERVEKRGREVEFTLKENIFFSTIEQLVRQRLLILLCQ